MYQDRDPPSTFLESLRLILDGRRGPVPAPTARCDVPLCHCCNGGCCVGMLIIMLTSIFTYFYMLLQCMLIGYQFSNIMFKKIRLSLCPRLTSQKPFRIQPMLNTGNRDMMMTNTWISPNLNRQLIHKLVIFCCHDRILSTRRGGQKTSYPVVEPWWINIPDLRMLSLSLCFPIFMLYDQRVFCQGGVGKKYTGMMCRKFSHLPVTSVTYQWTSLHIRTPCCLTDWWFGTFFPTVPGEGH